MNTAIVYSGEARSFAMTWANHADWLWTRCPNPHFFVSVADDEDAEDMRLIQDALPASPFFMEKVVQPQVEEPTALKTSAWHNANLTNSTAQSILRQLWSLNRAWDFVNESSKTRFDVVVRIRPDIAFTWLGSVPVPGPNTCLTPWFNRWGGVNDRFAVMPAGVGDIYFKTFEARHDLWDRFCPLHPETMIGRNLRRNGILTPHSLETTFFIVRKNGDALQINPSIQDELDYARLSRHE